MENKSYEYFITALKYCVAEGWSRRQNMLAEKANISASTLTMILKRARKASMKTQVALSDALGIDYMVMLDKGRELLLTGKVDIPELNEGTTDYKPKEIEGFIRYKKPIFIDERLREMFPQIEKMIPAANSVATLGNKDITLRIFEQFCREQRRMLTHATQSDADSSSGKKESA